MKVGGPCGKKERLIKGELSISMKTTLEDPDQQIRREGEEMGSPSSLLKAFPAADLIGESRFSGS